METVAVFGDSIAFGFNDREGGWVERLRRRVFDIDKSFEIYNLSISGNKSYHIVERLEFEASKRNPDGIVIAIGINDSQLVGQENAVPPEKFVENMERVIEKARKFGKVVTIGLTPVDEEKTTPIPWNPSKSYLNKEIRKYENALKGISEEKGIPFLPLFDKLKDGWEEMLDDGLHPNGEGHERIFSLVEPFLRKEGMIP